MIAYNRSLNSWSKLKYVSDGRQNHDSKSKPSWHHKFLFTFMHFQNSFYKFLLQNSITPFLTFNIAFAFNQNW